MIRRIISVNYKHLLKKRFRNLTVSQLKRFIRLKSISLIIGEFLFLFLIFILVLISLSIIVDNVSLRDFGITSSEFLSGKKNDIFESFAKTIEYSFIGNAPSFVYQPFLTYQLLDNYLNTLYFILLSLGMAIGLSIFQNIIRYLVLNPIATKIINRSTYLSMIFPGATLLILISFITLPLNGNSLLHFNIENPLEWILPIFLVGLPLSTFISSSFWELYVLWINSLERKLFNGLVKRRRLIRFIIFLKLYWNNIVTILLFTFITLVLVTGFIEYVISFSGIGSFFINSLKKNDIWVIEPIICWFIYLVFFVILISNINRWSRLNSPLWWKVING